MPSFVLRYRAKKGTLVGGVKESQSCRYQRMEDIETRLSTILEHNPDNVEWRVVTTKKCPEIFVHCGKVPQAIGARCPACGHILTLEDALAAPLVPADTQRQGI